MREVLEQQLRRFGELERQLVDPEVLANPARLTAVAREHGALAKLATKYRRLKDLNDQLAELEGLVEGPDAEMRELAEAELPELRRQREACWDELLEMTVGGADASRTSCIVEIRGGTGGEEAALFARDLYEMYRRYGEDKRWKVEIMDLSPAEMGGFKEVIFGIEGEDVFRRLQYESGVHRVQRVPETEAKGRRHTSTATVAVMAEPEDVEIDLKPEDYEIDRFRASGPGGQHVNKTSSAIRLTHLASGIVVVCQDEKSQHKNLAKALRVLRSRLYDAKREEEHRKRSTDRKTKIGTGERSEKIRTYNFPENRLTDHRIGLTLYKLDTIMAGDLDPVVDALLEYERREQRAAMA